MRFIFEKFLQVKKRSLFLLGVLATGLLGSVGGYLRVHISKEDDSDSLLASTAHADVQEWGWQSNDGGGEGCGGCSADSSGG